MNRAYADGVVTTAGLDYREPNSAINKVAGYGRLRRPRGPLVL